MEKQQEKTYKIVKSDINKWKELNGSLNQNCALALEIKANNANYYYIEENGKIVADFAIYKEIKWITTRSRIIQNKELFDLILEELKRDFDEIMTIQPVENEEIINYLLNKFWAFKSQTISIKSLVLYIGLFIFNITFSSQFIVILSNVGVKSIVAKFISMILITCWNFILYKKVVFKE